MSTLEAWVAITGGSLVIGGALWRIGTAVFRLVRKFDKLFDEHTAILATIEKHGTAIEQLQRRAERRARNGG